LRQRIFLDDTRHDLRNLVILNESSYNVGAAKNIPVPEGYG